jgi:two-component sensor histidine kinase
MRCCAFFRDWSNSLFSAESDNGMGVGLIKDLDMDAPAKAPTDLYVTDDLLVRPEKTIDHAQEKRALLELARRMLDHPQDVLPRFVELAMTMTGGISAGLSLYEPEPVPGVFRWRHLKGLLAPFENATMPRNYSPSGIALDENRPVLTNNPERFYSWIADADIVVPEVLLVPLKLGGTDPLGTLWIVAETRGHFDSGHARAATELATFVGAALKMVESRQKLQAALEEQETLAREMSHRIKNLFAVAESMVRMSARSTETKEEMTKSLIGRFHALASAHGLIRGSFSIEQDKQRLMDLTGLLAMIVAPHERPGAMASRFHIQGPSIACGAHALNGIALVFHELATNAAKYGALTCDRGEVDVRWQEESEDLVFHWVERGGPEIAATPEISGFGSKLLRDTILHQFSGHFAHDWQPHGLEVTVRLPMKNLIN